MILIRRWIKILLLLAVILLLAGAAGFAWLFCRSQPTYAGRVAMPGLAGAVNVYRDEHGVPHIFANNINDAARALGYIHADERLFQMEMQRRAGAGRLSEIFGADMLDVDQFTRTLGLYRLAQDSYKALSPDAQTFFESYADGVNLWLTTHHHALPPEFFLLGIKPEPWAPADSLVWGKLMALQLSENYKHEILRARLAKKLSPAQMEQLFPPVPAGTPVTTMPGVTKSGAITLPPVKAKALLRNARLSLPLPEEKDTSLAALDKLGAITSLDHAASNEWVIGGARTKSGKPILANDPHLGLEAPILWYLARIVTPDLSLEGATVPGLPVVLLGQNGHVAWGFTTTGSDVQDLFVESVDAENPDRYLTPGGVTQPFETRTETIHVKGAPDVTLTVRATRHGPVLSDIDPELAQLAGTGKVMALAFTALGDRDTTPEALMRIDRAANAREFMAALQLYQAPPQNIVYADTAGNIGFIAAGLVPVRKAGDGLTPADGASGNDDWTGMIPFAEEPHLDNPPAGFVFNANNAVVGPGSLHFYGEEWEEPFRAERLQQFFDTTGKHDLDTSALMQADHVSLAARQSLPYLLRQKFSDARKARALEMLRGWDGVMDKNLPEPLIFEAWLYELHQSMLADKAGDPLKAEGPFDALALLSILSRPGDWCGPAGNCDDAIRQSFTAALALLTERDGNDMAEWRWGDEHAATLLHKFWSHVPILDELSTLRAASSGDFYTLDRGGSSTIDAKHPFIRTHGGGFRGIYDLSDPAQSRFMIATGESGHVFTKHYRDLFKPWNNVQSFTLTGTEEELKARGLPELVFEPVR